MRIHSAFVVRWLHWFVRRRWGRTCGRIPRVWTKKTVFLVTSTIRPTNRPLCYSPIRTVFEVSERYAQTLASIESIRRWAPGSLVFLIESSPITPEEAEGLAEAADWFLPVWKDRRIEAYRDGPYKGAGEAYMLLQAMRVLRRFRYDRLFKLSGRYRLTKDFLPERFPGDKIGALQREGVYSTRLYCVPQSLEKIYVRQLRKALAGTSLGKGIETVIVEGVKDDDLMSMDRVGVAGESSADGVVIEE